MGQLRFLAIAATLVLLAGAVHADDFINQAAASCHTKDNRDAGTIRSLGSLINTNPGSAYYHCSPIRVTDVNGALPIVVSANVWMRDRNGASDGYCTMSVHDEDGTILANASSWSSGNSSTPDRLTPSLFTIPATSSFYTLMCRVPGKSSKASSLVSFELREWF